MTGLEDLGSGPSVRAAFERTQSLFALLKTVRSRRVGHGYRIDSGTHDPHPVTGRALRQARGPLHFISELSVPLSELEEALLCWAACGPNGLVAWDVSLDGGFNQIASTQGRTAPEPNNTRATDLLVLADHGCYLYRPESDPTAVAAFTGGDDDAYGSVLEWYRSGLVRLSDRRPDVDWAMRDEGAPNAPLHGPHQANMNRPGTLWLLPVADAGYLQSGLVDLFARRHAWIADDFADGRPAGLQPWLAEGRLERPVSLSGYEQGVLMNETYPAGCMVQNVRLAAEALGLGSWCFSGHDPQIVLGGRPELAVGLGFQFEPANFDAPVAAGRVKCSGLPGVKDATLVPTARYPTPESVVEHWYSERHGPKAWGSRGADNAIAQSRTAWRPERAEDFVEHPDARPPTWAWDAATAYIRYCVDCYGQWPVTYDPIQAGFGVTIHHVDADFYREHYRPGLLPEAIVNHHSRWH